ncbi:hypothetical protein ESZ48_14445 [Gelidibacter gilvus]|uniref:Tail specific protease domain-containing protein n=1 Tax=Gelidibacter gilvus TaxID=59602 RepID=A0A4Q0XGB5_9FLAO|nr:hypothetical protein ESZ48_14445 [Gelidibacter gilvus]
MHTVTSFSLLPFSRATYKSFEKRHHQKIILKVFLLVIAIFCFTTVNAQKKISSKKLHEDFDYLIEELQLQHQGLYQYVGVQQTDREIDSIRQTLQNPMTRLEFYKKLRYVIGLTNEGHTSIALPNWTMFKIGISKSFLPLAVKLCDQDLIVTQNFGKDINGITNGVKLIAINDKTIPEILEQLYPLIPTDGFNETSKHEWVGGLHFSLLYRLVYGKEKKLELQVQEFGSNAIKKISIPPIRFTTFKNKNAKFKSKHFDYQEFKFEAINDSIAYLSVPSFSRDDSNHKDFFQTSFKKIDSLNIKHLILDVQANGGGTEGTETLLFSYLSKEVIQKYKQVTMLQKPYHKNKHKHGYIEDDWAIGDTIAKRGEYTLFTDYYSDLYYEKPDPELIYSGKVYVLISGATFSGGAEFASLMKMTDRAVFIGEETGGTYEGNVSGYSETITLPYSKVEVDIPTVHFQMNVSPEIKGRGVMPDFKVPQSWEAYLYMKNAKKEFAIELITE